MGRKKEVTALALVLLVVIVLSFFSFFVWERFTGYAIIDEAYGGNVTQLNLGSCSKWFGFFGNMTGNNSGDPNSFDVGGCDDVLRQNLGLVRCFTTELYATPARAHLSTSSDAFLPSAAYMNSLSAATVTLFDSFFNFTTFSDFTDIKGAAVFNETAEFNVGDGNLTVFSQTLSPRDSNYTIGLLKDDDDNVILVFRIANGTAFNGEQVDFEMMLPAHPGNITYYFFQDRTDDGCDFSPTPPAPPPTPAPGPAPAGGGGGGGSGAQRPRCGDQLCQYTENCTICPVDCGRCPVFEMPLPAPFPMVFEREKIVSDDKGARELFVYAQELVLGHSECYALSNLVDKAKNALEAEDYVLTILYSHSVIQECEARLAAAPPVLLEPAPSLSGVWILLAAVIIIAFFIAATKKSKWLKDAGKTGRKTKRGRSAGKSRTRKRRR